jgi:hypothetical protein
MDTEPSTGEEDDDDSTSQQSNSDPPTSNGPESTTAIGDTTDTLDPSTLTGTSPTGTATDPGTSVDTTAEFTTTTVTETTVDTDNNTTDTNTTDSSSSTGDPPPSCDDGQPNGGETDLDCGGPDCSPCDDGGQCNESSDCNSGVCTDNLCAVPACDDGALNQDESDIDCGGAVCPQCLDGDSCSDSSDCESGVCDADICLAPTCEDNSFNQDETDVDCGGAVCTPCDDGQSCVIPDDCNSLVCEADTCVAPTCADAVQNQDEEAVDCGGATCAPCQLEGLILNEVDYDQAGNDTLEFIEIYNNTGGPVSLVGVKVALINGMNSATYANIDLSAQVSLDQGQYLLVANPGVVAPPGVLKVNLANDTIQNGAPDGIALVDTIAVKLLDAISYEGSMTNATVTGLGMNINLVEGAAFPTADAGNGLQSIARFPNGNDKNNALTDLVLSKNPTPGLANTK